MSSEEFKPQDELAIEIAKPLPPFSAGQVLTIKKVEYVKTALRGFEGIRVTAVDDDGNEYAEMLWLREVVGPTSKLGTFIVKLGNKPAKWVGKRIRIVSWTQRNRQIEVVE